MNLKDFRRLVLGAKPLLRETGAIGRTNIITLDIFKDEDGDVFCGIITTDLIERQSVTPKERMIKAYGTKTLLMDEVSELIEKIKDDERNIYGTQLSFNSPFAEFNNLANGEDSDVAIIVVEFTQDSVTEDTILHDFMNR